MKHILFTCLLTLSLPSLAGEFSAYFKVGAGYKFYETDYITETSTGDIIELDTGGPFSARFELGLERGNFSFGIAHQSQWLAGWPFNEEKELFKSEIFLDYKFTLF